MTQRHSKCQEDRSVNQPLSPRRSTSSRMVKELTAHTSTQDGNFSSLTLGGFAFAAGAGFLAALSSVFGKFSMDSSRVGMLFRLLSISEQHASAAVRICFTNILILQTAYTLRIISFVCIFICNALMFNFFVKAMNFTSTVNAVVTNFSFNFFLSVVISHFELLR